MNGLAVQHTSHQGSVPIKGFLETSFVDWPGTIASVVFLPFCNFRCPYCHNHDLVTNPESLPDFAPDNILAQLRRFTGWIEGICVTGGEPTLHDSLPALLGQFKERGFQTKLDTNGSNPQMLFFLKERGLIDYVAMDVKAPLSVDLYSRSSGGPVDLSRVVQSIRLLMEGGIPYEFRTTAVPGLHKEEDIYRLARELKGCASLTLQNFSPRNPLRPELRKVVPYPEELLGEIQERVNHIIHSP
jgi:pyruvate formate lyase activating enzyme